MKIFLEERESAATQLRLSESNLDANEESQYN